jgi:glycosyltransferase involved in cell wall biosynthesis
VKSFAVMPSVLVVAERALPDRGGLAVATSRIARQAKTRGEQVHLIQITRDAAPGARGRLERDGIPHHLVGALPREDDTLAALAEHVREIAREHGIDLVHSIYAGRAGYVATLVARQLGVPSVVSLRGNDLDRGLYRPSDVALLGECLRRATVVTAVSKALANAASRLFEREALHVTNSVDGDTFAPLPRDDALRKELGLADGAVLGFSGELREKKGIRFLLPAFAHLAKRRPVSLLLIGGVRKEAEPALEQFVAAMPEAAARLHLIPYERNATRLCRMFSLTDLMVFPSLWEGTPNAVLEAMAAGCLVLASSVGGHNDLIEHGVSGALLPLSDFDRLPAAVEEMLDLPEPRRTAMKTNARAQVLARHLPEGESRSYAAIYSRARGAPTRNSST